MFQSATESNIIRLYYFVRLHHLPEHQEMTQMDVLDASNEVRLIQHDDVERKQINRWVKCKVTRSLVKKQTAPINLSART